VRYRLIDGVRVESIAATWAAFSPVSGETLQLNDEAAAILELLALGPLDSDVVRDTLAEETQTEPAKVGEAISHVWSQLILAGLVRVD